MDRDWGIIIVLGIGWGTTFFFNELLLKDLGPLSVAFARISMAALSSWIYLLVIRQSGRIPIKEALPLLFLGACMFALPFSLFPIGQQYVATGVAGIVNALTPVMVVVISHLWPGGERATPLKTLGVAAGFIGIVLLTIPAFQSDQETKVFGTLIMVIAPVSYAVGLNWVRRFTDIKTSVAVTWSFTFAAIMLLPLVAMTEGKPGPIQPITWGAIVIMGSVLTGLFFQVGFALLPRMGATKTSSVTFIAPVSALLIGWWALGERLEIVHFAGMAAIFLGLFLIDGRLFRRKFN
ncbi:MAG: DMT family transporter [Paracoccaceae bacterium]